jgi:hypothetical protein
MKHIFVMLAGAMIFFAGQLMAPVVFVATTTACVPSQVETYGFDTYDLGTYDGGYYDNGGTFEMPSYSYDLDGP